MFPFLAHRRYFLMNCTWAWSTALELGMQVLTWLKIFRCFVLVSLFESIVGGYGFNQ